MDYRKTVNLPQTDFPQRASLAEREPQRLERWRAIDLYGLQMARRKDAPRFVLHDGPPYSNGHIHLGHALNKVLKDIVTRYHDLKGFQAPYVPGWDNHGLPIEYAVSREFQEKGERPDTLALRRRCREYAQEWIDVQREEFIRLGVRGDWDHPYLTMDHGFEAGIVQVFAELAKQGYVYRGERVIQWAPSLQTALADAEIEYHEHTSPSIYVAFPVTEPGEALAGLDDAHVVIWTTTPWTIPANLAIALHPDIDYRVLRAGGKVYVLSDYLANGLADKFGWDDAETLKVLPGSAFVGTVTHHPLYDRPSPLLLAPYVTLEEGTGCVHTAPGHGKEDFELGREHGLPAYCPVDEAGVYTHEVGERLEGRKVLDANDEVVAMLSEAGALLSRESYRHQYPYDWRARQPIIYRATTQWFLNIDHAFADGETHRSVALDAIAGVRWVPREGEERIKAMVAGRPDWCLSRQRAWGVGIPVFYHKATGEPLLDPAALDHVVEVIREKGSDAWFELEPRELLPAGYTDPETGAGPDDLRKETDVLDVWFDSGSTHQVLYTDGQLPVDLYLEGSDQHRGWFNSSLMVGVGCDRRSPYKTVVTHGFALDAEGRAMSKSLGNTVSPQEVIATYGADVLRLWVASLDFFSDVRMGDEILKRVADTYRNIRNSFRFMLGNLHDFHPVENAVALGDMPALDRYMLHRLETVKGQVLSGYESYEFHRLVSQLHHFVLEVSAMYLDVLKDELYCGAPDGPRRRSAQTVLYTLADELARMLAPILCFTADEVWEHLPGDREVSVHVHDWPAHLSERLDVELAGDFARLLAIRDVVKAAQEAYNQGRGKGERVNPLEMLVRLTVSPEDAAVLEQYAAELRPLLVVSRVAVTVGEGGQAPTAEVEPCPGERCERCWRVWADEEFGGFEGHESLCNRCAGVVETIDG